ncbi:Tail length tape measure protein [Desulfovibrio sp. DV]|uniref:phage tail tape measure protein n=1 Tax=Desulfovibrio sp. DV TaxID=1844708 RepID=UPI00094BA171|nr:phage tail tape measure protein [Desulfovibrio sp. DV]OLN31329.1 Tail length tape measure protein [Desulfovibrio sp. DV]
MRIKAGTLGVDITADGQVLEAALKRADSLTESFSVNVDRRMKRASASFQGVGQAAGMTDKEMASLEKRMREGMAADTATRALDNLRKYAGLTAQEYTNLAAKMGVATRESDKASISLAGIAKRAGAVAAAYLSMREGARAAGQAFMDFVGYEANLTDMSRVTTDSLESIDATIKGLPRSMGDPTAMMGAYYQVLSSGATDSAQAMDLLTTSAKASKAAHVSQSETVKGLTKLMAGYDGEIRSATEASDLLFRIDNLGQTSFAELVPVIGDVAEVTHLVGVTSQEMAAGLALVTQTSGSTSEAATKWKAIMVGLYKPTENMEKVLKALGYESGQAMVQQLGFAGTLQKLQAVAEASGFSMGKLFESSEALTGIAGLGAQEWERYTGILDGVRQGSDETDQAWQRWLGTSQAVKDNYDATLKQMAIEFGGELAPMMTAGMQTFADTVVANKGPIITTLGGIEMSVQAITSMVMAATREYQTFANTIAAGIAVVKGEMAFGDWALSGPEELAKKLQAAGDKVRANAAAQAKEARTQALMAGDSTGTIPELAQMFPGDTPAKVDKAKKAVDGVKVALKDSSKAAENAALAAERYGDRAASYFDQVEYAIAGLSDSLSGGLEGETLKVDKTFDKIFADIRKNTRGAKGDTEDFARAWVAADAAWPMLHMIAQLKDFEKELDKAAKYARDMGTYLSDPEQLQAADWLEGYKQYVQDLREARATTDQEDAAAVAKAQARWDAYQQHVLKAELDRLGEGGKLSEQYWASEKKALENHLAAVKQNASDETAYKVYEAGQWDAFLKAQLEEQAKYAGTFGETLAAKWSLAFGGYESEVTKAKRGYDSMADGIIESTEGAVDALAGSAGDAVRIFADGTATVEDLWQNLLARMADSLASFIEKWIKQQLTDALGGAFSGAGSDSGGLSLSGLTGTKSSSSSIGDGVDALKSLGDYLGSSAGKSVGEYLTTAGSSGTSLFVGGGNALADIFAEGIDVSSLGAAASTYNTVGATAMASTYGAAETAAMSATSVLGTVGSVLGVVGAIGGVVGLLSGLFGEQEKEPTKTASGYNVNYAGGRTAVSGVDFYSDGSVVGTGASDPAVTRQISDAFKNAAEEFSDAAENLGFTVDKLLDNFEMPEMNLTNDQVGDYIEAGTNALAFQALEQAGLRGAFDVLADDGQTYADQIREFSAAFSTVVGTFSAYGYEVRDVAQITQDQIDTLRAKTVETAQGTSQAIMTMAQSMGATSDQLAQLAANASDGSQALAVTDQQLENLLAADYAEDLLKAVGGEDAFAAIMGNLTANVFDTIGAYAENLGYYEDKAAEAISKLGDAGVTVDNFWTKFDQAIKDGLTVDEFEAWGKASGWVANIDSVTEALVDWNDAMTQMAQSLDARLQKARGLDYEAEITELAAAAEWELADARAAGYDATVIARLQEVQAAELAAKIAEHQADYADKLRDANKRYAEAVGDSSALVGIAIEENALELAELARTFNWSPGSSEEGLFQALQQAQWAEIIAMIQETGEALAEATRAMRSDLAARRAAIDGYEEEAEALQMVAGYADELAQAYADGLDDDLIAELMAVQLDELAKYWSDVIDDMQSDLEDLYRTQADLLDALSGNTKSAIDELYALFARYQAGEEDLADDIIDSLKSIASAINDMVEDIYATIYEIRTGSSYTTDDAATVATNSKAYFEEQYAAAASGDTEAMANVTGYAKDYLTSLRASTADQSVYDAGVDYITSMLSRLATSGAGIGEDLGDIGETVTDDQIAAAQEALHRAQVAQLKSEADAYLAQASAALQGSDIGNYLAAFATTGTGWQGIAHLLDGNTPDGTPNWLASLRAGNITIQSLIGWFLREPGIGTGTGYVDWQAAVPYVANLGILPSGVASTYADYQDAYENYAALKAEYGFATGGMIEGGIPGEDSVFVLGKPGEAVLTERQTDMLLLLAERIQGVMLGGGAPAVSGRDDLAAEVVGLRREVGRLGDQLRGTQERIADNTREIASMLARCGGKDNYLTVQVQP